MADKLLQVLTNKPGTSRVTLIDAEPSTTGYRLMEQDLGAPVFDATYSGARGTQGAVLAGTTAQNRQSTWQLEVVGTSMDDLMAKLSVLWRLEEELRRYGGKVTWRAQGSTYRMYLTVLNSGIQLLATDWVWEHRFRCRVAFAVVTPPYMEGDPLDGLDDFIVDSEGDYTFDAGSASDVSVNTTTQVLAASANLSVEKRLIQTVRGHSYTDLQATIKAQAAAGTGAGYKTGVVLRRTAANNYLEVYVDYDGTNTRLRVDKVVAGSRTNLATKNVAAGLNFQPQYVRGRIEGALVLAEWFNVLTPPSPMVAPTDSTSVALSAAEQATFASGLAGIVWVPSSANSVVHFFDVQAYTYRNLSLPDQVALRSIPGDALALCDLEVTPSGGSAAPMWAAVGWWPKPLLNNRVWNGDFENAFLGTNGWSTAAVTNITAGATSIGRLGSTTMFLGSWVGHLTLPATIDAGVSFRMFGRFKRGVTYTAEANVLTTSGATPNIYIRLGNGAANDKASGTSVALTGSRQKITVQWTPTANYDDAHVAINIVTGTASTPDIDGVMVYEGTTAPTAQAEGLGGMVPLGIIEAESAAGSPTSSANYRSGLALNSPQLIIDPGLLVPDDHALDTIAVEVWGRIEYPSGGGATTAVLSAQPISGTAGLPVTWTDEFGPAGRTLVAPSSGTVRRLVRLGTLQLATDARYVLTPIVGNGTCDYFIMLPANMRAASPSGKADDGTFPEFVGTTNEVTRTIRSDLSGRYREPGLPDFPAPGLGGALLELPAGDVDAVVKLSSLVPDDPTSNTNTEQLAHSATVHFAITPRWRLGR